MTRKQFTLDCIMLVQRGDIDAVQTRPGALERDEFRFAPARVTISVRSRASGNPGAENSAKGLDPRFRACEAFKLRPRPEEPERSEGVSKDGRESELCCHGSRRRAARASSP